MQFTKAGSCGQCVQITLNGKTVSATIVDLCPGCSDGDLDVTLPVFTSLADQSVGRIKMNWVYVACGTTNVINDKQSVGPVKTTKAITASATVAPAAVAPVVVSSPKTIVSPVKQVATTHASTPVATPVVSNPPKNNPNAVQHNTKTTKADTTTAPSGSNPVKPAFTKEQLEALLRALESSPTKA